MGLERARPLAPVGGDYSGKRRLLTSAGRCSRNYAEYWTRMAKRDTWKNGESIRSPWLKCSISRRPD